MKVKEIKITQLRVSTGPSYDQRKMSKLIRFISNKMNDGFTGELKINFHKGNFSTKVCVKEHEEL
jgi:hypothetical protein